MEYYELEQQRTETKWVWITLMINYIALVYADNLTRTEYGSLAIVVRIMVLTISLSLFMSLGRLGRRTGVGSCLGIFLAIIPFINTLYAFFLLKKSRKLLDRVGIKRSDYSLTAKKVFYDFDTFKKLNKYYFTDEMLISYDEQKFQKIGELLEEWNLYDFFYRKGLLSRLMHYSLRNEKYKKLEETIENISEEIKNAIDYDRPIEKKIYFIKSFYLQRKYLINNKLNKYYFDDKMLTLYDEKKLKKLKTLIKRWEVYESLIKKKILFYYALGIIHKRLQKLVEKTSEEIKTALGYQKIVYKDIDFIKSFCEAQRIYLQKTKYDFSNEMLNFYDENKLQLLQQIIDHKGPHDHKVINEICSKIKKNIGYSQKVDDELSFVESFYYTQKEFLSKEHRNET
ncbi:hypothetical protein [Candidatus Uabimicrobium amorphum]|uniref:Uncharacterized protein n=1 Tax=Uabimicrobium amorphum TaxID=2596890 RepID=A0A5S9IR25_UABAM|nr:hypothetical protein [Candidatus Uabimicrobium amorphum]BBM86334.1 hypothetical protein UABAM_04720 [Candidatus Uabimicrobium amorphum]